MEVNLYFTPYFEKNNERRLELETCYEKNLVAGFNEIHLVVENKDLEYATDLIKRINVPTKSKIKLKVIGNSRPPAQVYFEISKEYDKDRIHCICNSDIYIQQIDLNKIKNLNWNTYKLCLALARWDEYKSGNATLLDRADTADFWAFKGMCDVMNANCPLGFPGVDNSLAWKFMNAGYYVVNPSKDIITRHLHNVKGNNYRENGSGAVIATQICPEPYHFHKPITINEIYENSNNKQFIR